ncbi:MAG: hypothetical protein JO089_08810, partial [Alphaproteobacteria bacterium]|nr:hypothetical protein [Alphaproteobacteria bacterium]
MPDSNRQTPDDNGEYELTVGQGEAPPLLPAETVESPLEASGLKDVMAGLYHAVEKYDALIQERFNSMNVASAQTAEQVTELQAQVKQLQEQVGQPSAATAEIATTVTALAAALEEIKTQMASNTPANPGKIPDGQDTRATGPSFLQEPHKSDPEIPGAEHFDDPQDTRNVLRVPLTERVPHLQVEDIVGVENLLKQLPGENNNVKWRRQPNGDIYLAVGKKVDFPAYPPDDAHDSVTLYLA